ncbi:MAG: peptidase renal dipeptidase [Bacteroidetes bacterium]|nr:peptidase renal dipeptidase [Bacteroidota bacterium]
MRKKILITVAVLLALGAVILFGIVPRMLDRKMNTTIHQATAADRVSWYDSIPFIADMHCDALLWNRDLLKRADHGHVDIPRMQEANAALQIFTITSKTPRGQNYESNSDKTDQIALLAFVQLRAPSDWFSIKARSLHQIEALHKTADRSKGTFRVITNKVELEQYIKDRSADHKFTAGMLGLEGAHCLEDDINNLDTFYKAGVRYIGLAHFFDNEWAGSAHGVKKGGLTDKGRQLLHRMDSLHITIDLAHQSPQTISDIFACTSGPLIVSHTGVKGMCDNVRNLSDAQIQEIGKRNGLIGIGMWEMAVCGTDAAATAKSIKYVADRIGVEHVAMGSDFDGAINASYDITGFPVVVNELIKLGFSRSDIEKIMGGNVRDFFLRNLPER